MPRPNKLLSDPPMRLGCPTPAMCDELMICHGGCACTDEEEEVVRESWEEEGWVDVTEGG